MNLTVREARFCEGIRTKDRALRDLLKTNELSDPVDADQWLSHLCKMKALLGNVNNDVSFLATLIVKRYLSERFGIEFDAAAKAQGAPGIDIEAKTKDGQSVVGELKTTTPYQPGFGAQQKVSIRKDLARLANHSADHRIMFVIDADTYRTICTKIFSSTAPGVEIVDLVTGQTFKCG
jgi:hypothetical protein